MIFQCSLPGLAAHWVAAWVLFSSTFNLTEATLRHQGKRSEALPAQWPICAEEGEAVSRSGRARFGWGSYWVEARISSGDFCSSSTFGTDPAPYIRKVCRCHPQSQGAEDEVKEELGFVWRRCAIEGGSCPCESGVVRFGVGSRWLVSDSTSEFEDGISLLQLPATSHPRSSVSAPSLLETSAVRSSRADFVRSLRTKQLKLELQQHSDSSDAEEASSASSSGSKLRSDSNSKSNFLCSTDAFRKEDPEEGMAKECWCEELSQTQQQQRKQQQQQHQQQQQQHQQEASLPDQPAPPQSLLSQQEKSNRVAIVLLSRRPPDLKLWLKYHVGYMEVDHIFLQVEDSPLFNETWNALSTSLKSHVTVWRTPARHASDPRPIDDYETLQRRQLSAMARARDAAAAMGITWLVHIDDDELLYAPMHRPLYELFGALPSTVDQAFIPNVEAVYPSVDVENCFAQTKEVNMNAYTFASYANGKAAVRLTDASGEVSPAGPHMWQFHGGDPLPSLHLDREPFGPPIMVVHFESCPFDRWESKFWELGNTSPGKVHSIPFPFYRESLERMQSCTGEAHDDPNSICSKASLESFWSKWKTAANPSLTKQDLMPLNIPWADIERMRL